MEMDNWANKQIVTYISRLVNYIHYIRASLTEKLLEKIKKKWVSNQIQAERFAKQIFIDIVVN